MSTVVTRAAKGFPLSWNDMDNNINNLNNDKLEINNNLSDVANATTARTNLNAQTYNANLTTVGNTITSAGLALIDDVNAAAQRTTLGLVPGTDVQGYSNILSSIATGLSDTSYRNLLVNSNMKIDVRNSGASQTITSGAALAYTVDQWYAYCTGANVTSQQISSGNEKRLRITGAASNTAVGIGQRMTANSTQHLANNSAYLQIKASSTSVTTLAWALYYANSTDSFGTIASPTRTLIANSTFSINSTEQLLSAGISIPSAATTGLELVITIGALTAGNTLIIGDVQLEKNGTLGSYEHKPDWIEDLSCRYFCQIVKPKNYVYTVGAGAVHYHAVFWPAMRTSPSVSTIAQGLDPNTTSTSLTIKSSTSGSHTITATADGFSGADSTFLLSSVL